MLDELRQIKGGRKELRKFGITVGIAFAVLGGLLLWRGRGGYPYCFGFGALLVLLGLAVPSALKPIHKAWMCLAVVLGWFMTRVILGILFYIGFTPIGLVARLFGRGFLRPPGHGTGDTYWVHRPPGEADPKRYEQQF
ncbi:MAG TPA: SxtJ family membrane protein [bacterium]|nr:SxtJ family membrane protein [bacterium]